MRFLVWTHRGYDKIALNIISPSNMPNSLLDEQLRHGQKDYWDLQKPGGLARPFKLDGWVNLAYFTGK